MRVLLLLTLVASISAFAPAPKPQHFSESSTALHSKRRRLLVTGIMAMLLKPHAAKAKPASTFFFDENIENVREPSQMRTDGRLDINSAFVGEYKQFPGFFPHAAGKIASNGPYTKVSDIYKIKDLSAHDLQMFRKYEKELTVNPPGRAFDERINNRVST